MIDYFTALFGDADFPGVAFVAVLPYLVFAEWRYAIISALIMFVFWFNTDIEWEWPYIIVMAIYVLGKSISVWSVFTERPGKDV